ncbi:MAG: aromatic ring-hydroxylating dioxygenase subunit alpha [Anaerolineales bacterium]|nr:aromatic ring-hydroxylating dioxygenase subunit alpha [Anaerolineales bacterium]
MTNFAPYRPQRFTREDYGREETYRRTRFPVERALTIIPDAYRSAEFYALEQERVFANSWVAVGCTSQIEKSGEVLVANVAGQSILVTRDKTGNLRAFYNICRHRGVRLVPESGNVGRMFRCPYHAWAYGLDGACLGTPLFEGSDIPPEQQAMFDMSDVPEFSKADYGLLPVRTETWGCFVFVNLDAEAAPLSESLGDLPSRFASYDLHEWTVQRGKPYSIHANWKLIAENFMEYYHLPWVHPELVKVSRMEDHYRWQGPGLYTGMTTSPVSPDTEEGGWMSLPPIQRLSNSDAVSGRFIMLFPNLTISVLPNHVFAMLLTPTAPGHTLEQTYLLSHPESLVPSDSAKGLDKLMKFWDLVNLQDVDVVERVQNGLETATAYTGGRMCYKFEEPLHRFQNILIDHMVGRHHIPPGDAQEMAPVFKTPNGHTQ